MERTRLADVWTRLPYHQVGQISDSIGLSAQPYRIVGKNRSPSTKDPVGCAGTLALMIVRMGDYSTDLCANNYDESKSTSVISTLVQRVRIYPSTMLHKDPR